MFTIHLLALCFCSIFLKAGVIMLLYIKVSEQTSFVNVSRSLLILQVGKWKVCVIIIMCNYLISTLFFKFLIWDVIRNANRTFVNVNVIRMRVRMDKSFGYKIINNPPFTIYKLAAIQHTKKRPFCLYRWHYKSYFKCLHMCAFRSPIF